MANDYDVVIVGGGGAGLSAAIEATEAGARCVIVEADTKLGGATALSGGVFFAAGTSVQRAAGYVDDAQAMFDYLMTLNHWLLKPDVIRYVCDHSGPTLEWLISLGTVFPPENLVRGGIETVPRAHPSQGAGTGIADALINRAGHLGIDTVVDSRVTGLSIEAGRVDGIRVDGTELRAGAVVVATGGFGNSPAMLGRHYPTAAAQGSWTWAVHDRAPFILGDGLNMGERIGAAIVGHDTGLLLPSSGYGKFLEPFLPPWLMMVNRLGRRFVPEMSSYTISGYSITAQPGRVAYAIFDEAALVEASHDIRYLDPYNAGINLPTWEEATIRRRVTDGAIIAAPTLEAIAERLGIDGRALAYTVEQYNADCAAGVDSHFMQAEPKAFPVRSPPYYACEVRASVIGGTGAGLDIDRECRVLDGHGLPIGGLYAAGEVLGVLMGPRYGGGGMAIGPAIILGREAGRQAARLAMR